VGFLNTSYKFSLLVFEFTKTRDVPGSLQKTGDILGTDFLPGHESESGDCPWETGMFGNPKTLQLIHNYHVISNFNLYNTMYCQKIQEL
jgi:hypothetical protein